ncbi:hypothetical protein QCA50_012638 [Cerrena zonata]|uniref:Uncharacterized protein n=1 Tax=Cerrena zonata TaxID=2478898 RepID=A0AAW0FY22_9APHY
MTLRKSICTSRPVSHTARKTISASHASDEDGSDHDSDESLSSNEPAAIDNNCKNLYFIPDPNLRSDEVNMRRNVFYTEALVCFTEMHLIHPARGHFAVLDPDVRLDDGEHMKRVLIDKWLLLVIEMHRKYSHYFDFKVIRWENFLSWLMKGDVEHPETGPCQGADIVLGAIDYTTEYVTNVNGITRQNYQQFDEKMDTFSRLIKVWPPIPFSRRGAFKLRRLQILDEIATTITHTPRPASSLWDGEGIPSGKVLKRTHSAYGKHVYLPSSPPPSVDELRGACDLPGRQWIVQDWVPTLRQLGEYKVYFIEKEVVWISVARLGKDGGEWHTVDSHHQIRSLEHVAAMLQAGIIVDDYLFSMDPPQYSPMTSDLVLFARDTLEGLIARDRDHDGYSLLSEWCRMDIGIFEQGGMCSYFVNEVETNIALGLFGEGCGAAVMDPLARLWSSLLGLSL